MIIKNMPQESVGAPGAPGMESKWSSSAKSGIGKALNASSNVTLTISHGILNEAYYPQEDIACMRDMGFIVTDGHEFFSEEKRDTRQTISTIENGIPAYKIINYDTFDKYQITKEIIVDPFRNSILQQVTFEQKDKNLPLQLFALLAPHLNNEGSNNTGWIGEYKGVPMLFAQNGAIALAMACSAKWLKRSAGYVGTSDGWTDIRQHGIMRWEFDHANDGNVALTGEIDLSDQDFVVAISFGRTHLEAANHARASLLDGFDTAKRRYIEEWKNWQESLYKLPAQNFMISAAMLRMHEAKNFPGGIIASLSIPWGETKGDADKSGYHVVWPRDLVESAGGFHALKTKADVSRIVNYLMSTQNANGSWPQNMWLHGEPNWNGLQMDQVALPILEMLKGYLRNTIGKHRMTRYWPLAKKAIIFLLVNGPFTQQDRWEEESGFSPFTIAAEIAALLAGAKLAEINGEKDFAIYCRETADCWNETIEFRTYVTDTPLARKIGVEGYYIRINPFTNIPASELGNRTMELKNHHYGKGTVKINELISVDTLALVRFGIRDPNDPKILNTLKVIDAQLKVNTPHGPCWYRYNNDGYGEQKDGDPYDGTGIGRPWPLLSGERGHYEVAAGNIEYANTLLQAMDGFANNGLLPEQIWDTHDIPEKGLYFGEHTGSAMPLTWAHAEYIKLCVSIHDKKVFDMPEQTQERYLLKKKIAKFQIWRFDNGIKTIPKGKTLRIETFAACTIHWTDNDWKTTAIKESKSLTIGVFATDIKPENKESSSLQFTFYWKEADKWEGKNYLVTIDNS
ncbi:glycoside hydrolase family 15 protein [Cellulophaga sp. Z1A5H]|uniref:glycoside hydrolase family 15 protein n=1 Tax=Cellulophaga sp. Z1A5H TaxID=2687291 RepID=UPI0013FE24A7|nr:glycoside hydrolase family 15 protein [Cellulophaga sp. Z1A5H]